MDVLKYRHQAILSKIIQLYILDGIPIGSRLLSKYLADDLRLSPATIRNVMAELEDLNYITHPHRSAGRMPTDKGYRFYVDNLNSLQNNYIKDFSEINTILKADSSENILKDVGKLLSILTKSLSLIKIPGIELINIKQLEVIDIASDKILIIIAFESDYFKTLTIESQNIGLKKDINIAIEFLKEKLIGKNLMFIKEKFQETIKDYFSSDSLLIRLFIESVDKIIKDSGSKIITSGTGNLLDYPELENFDKIKSIIELVEDEDIIVHILDNKGFDDKLDIVIGEEIGEASLHDYSLIKSPYQIGSGIGKIGIIGPKRMDYPKIISIVKSFADLLSNNE